MMCAASSATTPSNNMRFMRFNITVKQWMFCILLFSCWFRLALPNPRDSND